MIELLKLCAEYPIEINVCYEPFLSAFVIKSRNLETNMAVGIRISTSEIESVPSEIISRRIIHQIRENLIDCKEEN
jgi:hypothetical protein